MIRSTLLLSLALGLAAEEAATPAPAPALEATTVTLPTVVPVEATPAPAATFEATTVTLPTVVPEAAAPAPAPAPATAPAPEGATAVAPPAPSPVVAAAAEEEDIILVPVRRSAPQPKTESLVSGYASLTVGYDSNVLQVSANDVSSTESKSLAASVDASVGVRILTTALGRLTLAGTAGYDTYPSEHTADLLRYGGNLAAAFTSVGPADPGAVVSYSRFVLDGDAVANVTSFNPYAAFVGTRQVGIIGLSAQYLDFLQQHLLSGKTYDATYRHWLLWDENVISRRLELSLRGAAFRSLDQRNDYMAWTPGAAVLWRFGDEPAPGTIDASLRTTWERRQYRDMDTPGEDQHIFTARASGDAWLTDWLTAGPYVATTHRESNNDFSVFRRLQFGVKTSASW